MGFGKLKNLTAVYEGQTFQDYAIIKDFVADVVFFMLINVQMSIIDGILTFMSMMNCMLSSVEPRCLINSGAGPFCLPLLTKPIN